MKFSAGKSWFVLMMICVVLVSSALAAATAAGIAGIARLGPFTCLCVNTFAVNTRQSACGQLYFVVPRDRCMFFASQRDQCVMDSVLYDFFQVFIEQETVWIAGGYLDIAPASKCSVADLPPGITLPQPGVTAPPPPTPQPGCISGTTPPVDSCFCVAKKRANIFRKPCGNMIGTVSRNNCYFFTGQQTKCKIGIQQKEYFKVTVGNTGWVDGCDVVESMRTACQNIPGITVAWTPIKSQSDDNCTEIEDQLTNIDKPCAIEYQKAKELEDAGMIGVFVPRCDADGYYSPKQFWGSTGESWCCDKYGKILTEPSGNPELVCPPAELTRCQEERLKAEEEAETMDGVYIPSCENNGDFSPLQQSPSTGYSWCADKDGTQLDVPSWNPNRVCETREVYSALKRSCAESN